MRGDNHIKTGSGAKIVIALLVIFALLPLMSWGACNQYDINIANGGSGCYPNLFVDCNSCTTDWGKRRCQDPCLYGGYSNCRVIQGPHYVGSSIYVTYIRCASQAEADSVKCALNPQAAGCTDDCTESKNECESQGGVFSGSAITGRCLGSCNLCKSEKFQKHLKRIGELCCEAGVAPPQNPQCVITGVDTSGVSQFGYLLGSLRCDFNNWESQKICQDFRDSLDNLSSSSVSSSSSSVNEYCRVFPDDLACVCADDPTNPDCAYLNSSSSEGAPEGDSSGSTGSSGSGGGGGEGSSGSGGGGAGGAGDWEYDYRDSLGKIIKTTARTANNTEGLRDSLGTIAFLLRYAPCLWGDCSTDTSKTDSLLGVMLDSTGYPQDTTDTGVLDSLGALGDSLAAGTWSGGWGDCDTTGGNKCDSQFIGNGGLDSAGNAIKGSIGALGDSLADGVVGDSLAAWQGLFSNGKLSGTGSNSCPAVFKKQYVVPLGISSATLSLNFVCRSVFGGVTAWQLARVLLRAIIAIGCMWWLFRQAMGLGGGSDDDD